MPWEIVHNHPECPSSRPWAVVKKSDGEREGCHPTEDAAKDQLAALNASEADQELAELAADLTHVFHLPGQHDQQSHAGGRRTAGGKFLPGVGNVDEYLANHPQNPGEQDFEWHSRITAGLPTDVKHALLYEVREQYAPVDYIVEGAKQYRAEHGLPDPQVDVSKVPAPLDKGNRVAQEFEGASDMVGQAEVDAAFEDFKRQNAEMFGFMTRPRSQGGMGISVDFSPFSAGDPYDSARAQADDLRSNRHLTIQSGLGGQHSSLTTREYDEFRAVHDTFGHAGVGGGFDRHGEYQAYLEHSSMYEGEGRKAMASEYHGVNTALWGGAPGTPGTGKSILLPDELVQNPWDDQGNLVRQDGWVLVFALDSDTLEALEIDEETAEGIAYLIDQVGFEDDFAQRFDPSPWHTDEEKQDFSLLTFHQAGKHVEQIDAPIMDVLALAYDFAVDRGLPPVDINQGFRMAEEKSAAREVETMTVTLGGSPNQGTKPDKRLKANRRKRSSYQTNGDCPEGQHQMPDGTCMDDEEEMGLEELEGPFEPWHGTLAVEGVETGDGREFAPGSLEWPEPPLPLMWQRETEERHGHSIVVGRIDTVERAGNEIKGTGVIKSSADVTEDMRHELAGGISVDVDSVKEADVELVFPDTEEGDAEEDEDGGLLMLFGPPPEKVVFHRGRIRGATLVALPAFVEARIRLGLAEDGDEEEALVAALEHREEFAAISGHKTGTAEGSWDAGAVQSRLPSPMPVATARGMYAWMASGAVEDGKVNKADLKFPHHNSPGGAANTTACSAGIAALNGARGGASIPSGDRSGVHSHLAGHLRAAGKEVPALAELDDVITAAAVRVSDETGEVIAPLYPPLDWFEDPALTGPTPFHVQDGGRISGHLAVWGTCHTTFADRCVTPPRRQSYDYFHKGELKTREAKMIGVGHITLGTGHAAARHGAAPAMAHYDHTGFVAADVRCGEDQYGIWVAGSLRPSLSELRLRELRGAALSGDWRRIGGRLQLVAVLAVNVPGFPVPRMRARMDNDDMLALTAAGVVTERRVERYHELLAAGDGHGTLRVKVRKT